MTLTSPNVAINSLSNCAPPARLCCEKETRLRPNITFAIITPAMAPTILAATYGPKSLQLSSLCNVADKETIGLRCAPEIWPKVRIKATRAAAVAIVFANKASATLLPESRSAMIPDPTTAATRKPVPKASATRRRSIVWGICDLNWSRCTAHGCRWLNFFFSTSGLNFGSAFTRYGFGQVIFQHDEYFPFITIGIPDPGFVL